MYLATTQWGWFHSCEKWVECSVVGLIMWKTNEFSWANTLEQIEVMLKIHLKAQHDDVE